MSAEEVTVTQSNSGDWWRMEFRGKLDYLEHEPTAEERSDFRRLVLNRQREDRVAAMHRRGDMGNVSEREVNG